MAIELITGRAGAPHVDSADVGAFNAAMFGGGAYVIEGVEATLQDANHVVISAGEMLCEGRHIRIVGAGETLTIDNGLSGYKRNDIVAMHYERDSSDIETCSLVVIKGNQATETQQDPPMPTSGKLLEGAASVYWPLYRIVIDGLTPQTPAFIAQRQALYTLGIGEEIPSGADLNDYLTPGKYFDNGNSVLNAPSGSAFFNLVVERIGDHIKQTVTNLEWDSTYANGFEWTRFIEGNGNAESWMLTGGIDSILAEGSVNGWKWTKYANGSCECTYYGTPWGYPFSATVQNGVLFRTNPTRISFPFNIVNARTSGQVIHAGGFTGAGLLVDDIQASYISVSYQSPESAGTVYGILALSIFGAWK